MSSSNNSQRNGLSLATVLTVVFVVLKLTHLIGWSWWWVLSPLWISLGLGILIFLVVVAIAAISAGRSR